jgi:hypothetical protein
LATQSNGFRLGLEGLGLKFLRLLYKALALVPERGELATALVAHILLAAVVE